MFEQQQAIIDNTRNEPGKRSPRKAGKGATFSVYLPVMSDAEKPGSVDVL